MIQSEKSADELRETVGRHRAEAMVYRSVDLPELFRPEGTVQLPHPGNFRSTARFLSQVV